MKSSEAAIKEIAQQKGNSANQIICNRLIHWKKSSEQRQDSFERQLMKGREEGRLKQSDKEWKIHKIQIVMADQT